MWDLRELTHKQKPRLWSLPARLDPVTVHPTRWGVGPRDVLACFGIVERHPHLLGTNCLLGILYHSVGFFFRISERVITYVQSRCIVFLPFVVNEEEVKPHSPHGIVARFVSGSWSVLAFFRMKPQCNMRYTAVRVKRIYVRKSV